MRGGETLGIIIGTFISAIICGALSASLHDKKGYGGGFWWGFFLGIIGLIYSAGLPVSYEKRYKTKKDQGLSLYELQNNGKYNGNNSLSASKTQSHKSNKNDEREEATQNYRICKKCGWQVFDDEEICSNCGLEVKK